MASRKPDGLMLGSIVECDFDPRVAICHEAHEIPWWTPGSGVPTARLYEGVGGLRRTLPSRSRMKSGQNECHDQAVLRRGVDRGRR
jgi:hypothetical protein